MCVYVISLHEWNSSAKYTCRAEALQNLIIDFSDIYTFNKETVTYGAQARATATQQ